MGDRGFDQFVYVFDASQLRCKLSVIDELQIFKILFSK
jgi:hypothetical protein